MCEPKKATSGAVVADAVGTVFSIVGLVLGSVASVVGASIVALCSAAVAMYLLATSSLVLAWLLLAVTAVCGIGTIVLLVKIVNRPQKQTKTKVRDHEPVTRASIEITRSPIKVIEARPIQAIEAKPVLIIEPITQTAELINRKEAVNER